MIVRVRARQHGLLQLGDGSTERGLPTRAGRGGSMQVAEASQACC